MSDLFGCSVFHGSDKHFSPYGERHLLAVGRRHSFAGTAGETEAGGQLLVVTRQADSHLFRTSVRILRINLAVVGVAKHTVSAHGKETHRMSPEGSEGTYLLRIIQRESIYIERTFIALTQEIHRLAVGSPDRVAVFSCTGRQVGMLACLGIIHPDVPRNGRSVMLAPFVFKSLAVLIKKGIPRRIKADQFGRCSQHLFGFSSGNGNLIQLCHG